MVRLYSPYNATFRVIEDVLGNYGNDTIKFTVNDPHRSSAFETNGNVLLFMRNYCGELFHPRHEYANVYKADNGRWAAPYQASDYNEWKKRGLPETIKPELIAFTEPVEFSIKGMDKERVEQTYPEPFFEIKGDKAIAIYGN